MRKIINISSFSRSRINQDPIAGSFYGWHSQYSREVHKRLGLTVESWSIDAGILHGSSYEREGVQYRIFPARFFLAPGRELSFGLLRALRAEMKEHDVIIHLHDFHNWQSYAIGLLFPKARVIGHYHGATKRPINRMTSVRKWLFLPLFLLEQWAEVLTRRRIRHYLLANLQDQAYYRDHGLASSFCPMAPDMKFFTPLEKAAARRELNIAANETAILNVGGFAPPKNLGLMIAAFAQLRKLRPGRLWLIGPTYRRSYRRMIEHLIDAWKLREAVTIVDFLPKSQLNVYYNAADVLAVTSNQDEGGPTVVLEALSLGLPVVATPVGFTRDIRSRTSKNLHLVEPTPSAVAQGLNEVLSGQTVRTPAVIWSWDDVMNVVRPLYEQLFRTAA